MWQHPVLSGAGMAGRPAAWVLTVVLGLALIACSIPAAIPGVPGLQGSFWAVACLVVLGQLRPVVSAGTNAASGPSTSTPFLLAILYGWGLWPAVLLGAAVCLVSASRRSPVLSALLFRVCTAAVAVAAGWLVLAAADRSAGIGGAGQEPHGVDLLWLVLAWGLWFLVDHALTAVTSADPARSLVEGIRADLVHSVVVTVAVVAVLPSVLASAHESVWFLVALLLPLVVVHETGRLWGPGQHRAASDWLPKGQLLIEKAGRDLVAGQLQPFVLAVVDIDRLTQRNDRLARPVGDRLLVMATQRLRAAFAPDLVVARLWGDKIAIYLPGAASELKALELGTRVRAALVDPFGLGEMPFDVQVNIGVALAPAHGTDAGVLICRADVALHRAKERHTGVEVYNADLDDPSTDRLDLQRALRSALDQHQLELVYLPRLAMGECQMMGVEAMLRWEHPTRGTIAPDEFIPLAENSGLMTRLTIYLIDAALEQVARWRAQGLDVAVAVSVSARDLHARELVRAVCASLARHRVPASQLLLQLTVRSLLADGTRVVDTLVALQARQVSPSLDEFGTDHTSTVLVRHLPVSGVTVDSSYVKTLPAGSRDPSPVRAIIELAHALGLTAVAEGVDTLTAWRDLVDLGCDSAQGPLVAEAMPPHALPAWLGQRATASVDLLANEDSAVAPPSTAPECGKLPATDQIGVRCPASARHS